MSEVKFQGHTVVPTFYRLASVFVYKHQNVNWHSHSWDTAFKISPWKIQGQGHSSRSYGGSNILSSIYSFLSFHENRPTPSWDTAISKFDPHGWSWWGKCQGRTFDALPFRANRTNLSKDMTKRMFDREKTELIFLFKKGQKHPDGIPPTWCNQFRSMAGVYTPGLAVNWMGCFYFILETMYIFAAFVVAVLDSRSPTWPQKIPTHNYHYCCCWCYYSLLLSLLLSLSLCGVWCRGLTTCLLYVCPLFEKRL